MGTIQFSSLLNDVGLMHLTSGHLVMWCIAGSLLYLGIVKKYEPYLMLPIGFGMLVVNLPLADLMHSEGILGVIYHYGIGKDLLPLLI